MTLPCRRKPVGIFSELLLGGSVSKHVPSVINWKHCMCLIMLGKRVYFTITTSTTTVTIITFILPDPFTILYLYIRSHSRKWGLYLINFIFRLHSNCLLRRWLFLSVTEDWSIQVCFKLTECAYILELEKLPPYTHRKSKVPWYRGLII
jgi:hypothetical protein